MSQLSLVEGAVTPVVSMQITVNDTSACTPMPMVLSSNGETFNMVLTSNTFVLDQEPTQRRDIITAFYDTMTPMPLICPPRYRVVALVKTRVGQSVMLDFFDRNPLNSDGTLRLNRFGSTDIRFQNGQKFLGMPRDQLLLAAYSAATRGIPVQIAPSRVAVFCSVE